MKQAANRRRHRKEHMKPDVTRVSVEIGDSEISFETGKLAKQASGSVVVQSGETHGPRHRHGRKPEGRRLPPPDRRRRGAHVRRGQDPRQLLPPRGPRRREGHAHRAHDRPPAAPALPQGLAARDPAGLDPDVGRPREPLRHPRDERRQRRADGVRHPVPVPGRRRAHRPGRGGQLRRQPRRGVDAREPARPRGLGLRGGHPHGRGRRQRDLRGGDPRRARHRPRRDQEALRRPARAGREGRQAQDGGRGPAGRRGRPLPGRRRVRQRAQRGHPGRGQARAPGRHQGGGGERAQVALRRRGRRGLQGEARRGPDGLRQAREGDHPQAHRRRQEAPRRPRRRRDPRHLDRGRRRSAHARLRDLHPRADAGVLRGRPRHHA